MKIVNFINSFLLNFPDSLGFQIIRSPYFSPWSDFVTSLLCLVLSPVFPSSAQCPCPIFSLCLVQAHSFPFFLDLSIAIPFASCLSPTRPFTISHNTIYYAVAKRCPFSLCLCHSFSLFQSIFKVLSSPISFPIHLEL